MHLVPVAGEDQMAIDLDGGISLIYRNRGSSYTDVANEMRKLNLRKEHIPMGF